jgi:hypothetical protein
MTASTGNVPGRIFMSYRREDTAFPAGWLYDRLASHFGKDQVFKDIDSIELGDDFIEVITTAVGSCDVLLALIGGRWLTITGQDGRRRLDNPDDFVRVEIEAALARNVRVIPILVDVPQMPHADELPPSLAKLARRQALELNPNRFDMDTRRLLRVLDRTLAKAQEKGRRDAEEGAGRQRQVEQLQGQLRERAAVHDWQAVVAASEELATLDPAAADPSGLASTAREQLTRHKQAEEALARHREQVEQQEVERQARQETQPPAREETQPPAQEESQRQTWKKAARQAREEAEQLALEQARQLAHKETTGRLADAMARYLAKRQAQEKAEWKETTQRLADAMTRYLAKRHVWEETERQAREDPEKAFHLGEQFREQSDVTGARTAYQWAIHSGHPDLAPRAAFALGCMLMEHGDLAGAQAALKRATESDDHYLAPAAKRLLVILE